MCADLPVICPSSFCLLRIRSAPFGVGSAPRRRVSVLQAAAAAAGLIRIRVGIRLRLRLHGRLPVLLLLLFVSLGRLVLEEAESSHGAVDGQRVDQVEVVHADEVQQEVATQVAADDVGAVVLGEQQTGLVHLVVGDKAGRQEFVFRSGRSPAPRRL